MQTPLQPKWDRHLRRHSVVGAARLALSALLLVAGGQILGAPVISGPALAQKEDRDALMRKLRETESELAKTSAREEALASTLGSLAAERERINKELIDTAASIQDAEAALTTSEQKLADLQVREQVIRGSLSSQHVRIARLMAAMQRMGRNPPPVIVTRRKDALTMVRSAILLAHAFPELRSEAQILQQQLTALTAVTTGIKDEQKALREQTIKLAAAQSSLELKLAEKRKAQTLRQQELAAVRLEAARIRQSGANLQELVEQLDRTIARQTKLGEYNRRLREARAAEEAQRRELARLEQQRERQREQQRAREEAERQRLALLETTRRPPPDVAEPQSPASPPQAAPSPPPVAEPELAVTLPGNALTPSGRRSSPRADRLTPAIPFARARGKLPMPVRGRVVLGYNGRTKLGRRSKGIVIETRANAQITSPADGWIVYAGPFRSYGQLLILNGGDGYHILLAGLSRIDVQLGQFVLASEPIGAMGTTPGSDSGSGKPVLYVEFRKKSKPIDPKPWWAKQQVVAQK